MTNQFDENLKAIPPDSWRWKQAIVDVADTAWLCRSWFDSHAVKCTAADIVAMTQLILAREEQARAREPHESALDD